MRKAITPDRAVHRIESVCVSVAAGIASLKGAYEGGLLVWNLGSALGFGAGAAGTVVGGIAGCFAGARQEKHSRKESRNFNRILAAL
ncbi:MAG: hypothetical protein IJS39_04160 [Synergistaceae bacterium]|nr:hypothetical protein [Synergistaceae bacterium]